MDVKTVINLITLLMFIVGAIANFCNTKECSYYRAIICNKLSKATYYIIAYINLIGIYIDLQNIDNYVFVLLTVFCIVTVELLDAFLH